MKRVMTLILAVMVLFCGLQLATAEDETTEAPAQEVSAAEQADPEPAASEPPAPAPAAKPAAPEPAAKPAAKPAAPAPAAKPAAPEPAAEKQADPEPTAEKQADPEPTAEKEVVPGPSTEKQADPEPAGEPAEEEPTVKEPAEESVTEEPAAEPKAGEKASDASSEKAAEETVPEEEGISFTGTLSVIGCGTAAAGSTAYVKAVVNGANMGYSICWEKESAGSWKKIDGANAEEYRFTAAETAGRYTFRAVLRAEDGTVLTGTAAVEVQEAEPAEEPAAEETQQPEPAEEPAAEEAQQPESAEAAQQPEPAEEPAAEEDQQPVSTEEQPAAEPEDPAMVVIDDFETPLGMQDNRTIVLDNLGGMTIPFRENADGMSGVIDELADNTELIILSVDGDWIRVAVGEQIGYIYTDDLQAWLSSRQAGKEEAKNQKVTIFSSRRNVMTVGEAIRLSSRIEGFEGYEIRYQWECDKHDGTGFRDVSGANSSEYSFGASAESLSWDWRLSVYYR